MTQPSIDSATDDSESILTEQDILFAFNLIANLADEEDQESDEVKAFKDEVSERRVSDLEDGMEVDTIVNEEGEFERYEEDEECDCGESHFA